MTRWYAVLCTAAAGVCTALMLAGCPGNQFAALSAGGDSGDGTTLSEDAVFRVLGTVVEAETIDPETAPSAEDDQEYFGEDAALYAEVSPDTVALSEESINAETETDFGVEPSAAGRLAGRFWNDLPDSTSDESGGVFRGRWFSADDQVQGFLRGDYEPVPPGSLPDGLIGGGWFHGRYIDTEGRFRGFLRGRYGHTAGGRSLFYGRWLDRSFRVVGVLKGHWTDDAETDGGRFGGRWAAFNLCDEADSLPDVESAGLADAELVELEALELAEVEAVGFDAVADAEGSELQDATATDLDDELDLREADQSPCFDFDRPHGFLRGWHLPFPPDDEREGGVFRGRWRSADHEALGILFGRYVPRSNEQEDDSLESGDADGGQESAELDRARPSGGLGVADADGGADEDLEAPHRHRARWRGVFYGKYVGDDGELRGYVRGLYGTGPHRLGVFRGRYFNQDGEAQGILRGRWDDAPHRPGGPFFGVWVGRDLDGGD